MGRVLQFFLIGMAGFTLTYGAACGNPTVEASDNLEGGSGTNISNQDSGSGKDEVPGVPPTCSDADPAKMEPNPMVPIPAATFTMGCNAAVDQECKPDEDPAHAVHVNAFTIDKYEVTLAQYLKCVNDAKCTFPKCAWDPCANPDYPMACIVFGQARSYCDWSGKRLATEAEWEYAARGTDGRKYPWGNAPLDCEHANYLECGGGPQAVGSHPSGASPFGLLDMAGNAVEFTSDLYSPTYYGESPATNPTGPTQGDAYVGRGGGYLSEPVWQRASSRDFYEPWYSRVSMGFRCAK